MVFVIVGMGGGIGIGVVLVIVKIVKDFGVLIVGVVMWLFFFEGMWWVKLVVEGLENLEKNVDILIVVFNDCLLEIIDKKMLMMEVFKEVDDVFC